MAISIAEFLWFLTLSAQFPVKERTQVESLQIGDIEFQSGRVSHLGIIGKDVYPSFQETLGFDLASRRDDVGIP